MSDIRVTEQRITKLMDTAEITVFSAFDKCTIVACKLENGFILVESSACVDPANYNQKMGVNICKQHIRDRLWELEGYDMQKRIYEIVKE